MTDRQDTIAAIATPPGNGGIGIVRLSGKNSLQIAREITHEEASARRIHYCTFRDHNNRVIDKGLLLYFKAPHSFTGEDVIELHGHGGQVVMNMLLREALERGARLARPGEFSERAYLNDRIDLVQAEAIADLIESQSEQAARSAARSLEGDFSDSINQIIEMLVSLRVYVESALDFPEEEIDFIAGDEIAEQLGRIVARLSDLINRAITGRKLAAGLRLAIIGRPNVGKSSLLNRLLKSSRAIVTDIPGTTRDTIEDTFLLRGAPVTIVDTAGIRDSHDPVEQEGMKRSIEEINKADIILLMTDASETVGDLSRLLSVTPDATGKKVVLHNKIDLYAAPAGAEEIEGIWHVYISAKTGAGMELLLETLAGMSGYAEGGEDVVLARQRHINALQSARDDLMTGQDAYKNVRSSEILAEDLRNAQQRLGEITGEFHSEDLLGEIFSRFCIGK